MLFCCCPSISCWIATAHLWHADTNHLLSMLLWLSSKYLIYTITKWTCYASADIRYHQKKIVNGFIARARLTCLTLSPNISYQYIYAWRKQKSDTYLIPISRKTKRMEFIERKTKRRKKETNKKQLYYTFALINPIDSRYRHLS